MVAGEAYPRSIALAGAHVYWIANRGWESEIRRCPRSGGEPETVARGGGIVVDLVSDGSEVSWGVSQTTFVAVRSESSPDGHPIRARTARLLAATTEVVFVAVPGAIVALDKKSGTTAEVFPSGPVAMATPWVRVEESTVYASLPSATPPSWAILARAGLGVNEVITLLSAPRAGAVDGEHIYWTRAGRSELTGSIWRTVRSGTRHRPEPVADTHGAPCALAASSTHLYWAVRDRMAPGDAYAVYSYPKEPGPSEAPRRVATVQSLELALPDGPVLEARLVLDDAHLYWSSARRGVIERLALAGITR